MLEVVAVIFSLISVWLTIKENIHCWSIGIIGIVAYAIIFYQNQEYCNLFLQLIFMAQSTIGIIAWKKEYKSDLMFSHDEEKINIFVSILGVFFILYNISNMFNSKLLVLDSLTASISIVATILLIKKRIEAWILWIIANFFYIFFFIQNKLYLSSGLYFIFMILSIYGFIKWHKELKNLNNKN